MQSRASRQLVEFHRIIAESLADNHRQHAHGEAMVVEGGVEMPSMAHRHECGVGAEGSYDDGDFLYGFLDRSWSCSARFADFVEDAVLTHCASLSRVSRTIVSSCLSVPSERGGSCAGGDWVKKCKPIV